MVEHPNLRCNGFCAELNCAMKALSVCEAFWNATPQEPESTLMNVRRLKAHFGKLHRRYEWLSKCYDQLKATGDAEEIAKHAPEYDAFYERYKKIKDIQTKPEWNPERVPKLTLESEWKEPYIALTNVLTEDLRAAGICDINPADNSSNYNPV